MSAGMSQESLCDEIIRFTDKLTCKNTVEVLRVFNFSYYPLDVKSCIFISRLKYSLLVEILS